MTGATITVDNEVKVVKVVVEGPQGPKGDVGDEGPKGDEGDIGPQGPVGPQGPSIVFQTRAELSSVTVPLSISIVRLLGYSTAGDGGAATYVRVTSQPSTVGSYVQDAAGVYFDLVEREVDPRMFGAKWDGTTNDHDAILNAWNYVRAKNTTAFGAQYANGVSPYLSIPAGTGKGYATDGSRLILTGTETGLAIIGKAGYSSVLNGVSIQVAGSTWTLRNFAIIGSAGIVAGTYGIQYNGGRGASVSGLFIRDVDVGIDALSGSTQRITDVLVTKCNEGYYGHGAGDTELVNVHCMSNNRYGFHNYSSGEVKRIGCRARGNIIGNVLYEGDDRFGCVENYDVSQTSTGDTSVDFPSLAVNDGNGNLRILTSTKLDILSCSLVSGNIFGGGYGVKPSTVRFNLTGTSGTITSIKAGTTDLIGAPIPWAGTLSLMEAAITAAVNAFGAANSVVGDIASAELNRGRTFIDGPASWNGRQLTFTFTGDLGTNQGRVYVEFQTSAAHNYVAGDFVQTFNTTSNMYDGIERVMASSDNTHFTLMCPFLGTATGKVCKPNRMMQGTSVVVSGSSESSYNGTWQVKHCGPDYVDVAVSGSAQTAVAYVSDTSCTTTISGFDTIYESMGGNSAVNDILTGVGNHNNTLFHGCFNCNSMGARLKERVFIDPRIDPLERSDRLFFLMPGRGRTIDKTGSIGNTLPGGVATGWGGLAYLDPIGNETITPGDGMVAMFAPWAAGGIIDGRPILNILSVTELGVHFTVAGKQYDFTQYNVTLYGHKFEGPNDNTLGVKLTSGTTRATVSVNAGVGDTTSDLAISAPNNIILGSKLKLENNAIVMADSDGAAASLGVPVNGLYISSDGSFRVRLTPDGSFSPTIYVVPATSTYKRSNVTSSFGADWVWTRTGIATEIDNTGALIDVATNGPRLARDLTTVTAQGWRIEGTGVNGIRNPRCEGTVAGAPGTLPTNWSGSWTTNTDGINRNVIGTGVEDGYEYVDVQLSGTSSSTRNDRGYSLETTTGIAINVGEKWVGSVNVRLIAGTCPPLQLRMNEVTSGGTVAANDTGATVFTPTGAALRTQRYYQKRTITAGAFLRPALCASLTTGVAYDFTLRISLPKASLYPVATSIIRPPVSSLVASTRNLDRLSLSAAAFALMSGAAQGTAIMDFRLDDALAGGPDRMLFQFDDGSDNNRFGLLLPSGGTEARGIVTVASSEQRTGNAGAVSVGTVHRLGLKWNTTRIQVCLNGGNIALLVTGLPTGMTGGRAGQAVGSSTPLDGIIPMIALYARQLTDLEFVNACVQNATLPG